VIVDLAQVWAGTAFKDILVLSDEYQLRVISIYPYRNPELTEISLRF
jgi:hypothetical protein